MHKIFARRDERLFLWATLFLSVLTVLSALFQRTPHPESEPSFEHMYGAQEVLGGAGCVVLLLLAVVLTKRGVGGAGECRLAERLSDNPYPLLLSYLGVLVAASVMVYHNRPLNIDEYSVYFQAEVFAAGKLTGQFPPALVPWLVPSGHENHFFTVSPESGRIVTSYWPGFSLLLAPFARLGVPWLLNPLLATGTLYFLWRISLRLFNEKVAAGWVLLFSAASTAVAVNGISYYAMSGHLFLNVLYAWLLLELTPARLLLAGLAGSLALLQHNPVPHLLFALPWMVWILRQPRCLGKITLLLLGYLPLVVGGGFGWVWMKMAIMQAGAGSGAPGAALGASDAAVTGKANVPDQDGVCRLLQTPYRLLKEILTLPDFDFLWLRLLGFLKLFAWAVPGLPILAMLGWRRLRGEDSLLRLWAWAALTTVVGYLFVPVSQGHGWGFRYFHSAWAALPLLAASFVLQPGAAGSSFRRCICLLTVVSLFLANGLRFWQTERFIARHLQQLPPVEKKVDDDTVQLVSELSDLT